MTPDLEPGSRAPRSWDGRAWLGLLVVLCAALAARWPSLAESFWIDEVMSVDLVAEPLQLMLARIGFGDVHPPGYYLLLDAWTGVFGTSDLGARSLSLMAGLATVALLFSWVRSRAGLGAALFAGTLLALSTFHVHYSVEARSYALLTLVGLGFMAAAERWRETGERQMLALAVLCEVVALWTHYYALLLVALVNVHALIARRHPRATPAWWGAGQLVALAGFAPWIPMLLVQLFELPQGFASHLSDELAIRWVIAAVGPAPCAPLAWLGPLAGGVVLALAVGGVLRPPPPPALGAAVQQGTDASAANPVPRGLVIGAGLALLVAPTAPLTAMSVSEAMLDALVNQTPSAYGLLVVLAACIGVATVISERRPGRLEVSLPAFVAIGGPLLVALLHQVRPMLFLRNLLIFLPPLLFVAATVVRGRVWRGAAAAAVAAPMAIVSLVHAAATFMPRQDFKAAAQQASHAAETWVLPAWDLPGLQRYWTGPETALRPAARLGDIRPAPDAARISVVLSRPSRTGPEPAAVTSALEPYGLRPSTTWTGAGHRGGVIVMTLERGSGAAAP